MSEPRQGPPDTNQQGIRKRPGPPKGGFTLARPNEVGKAASDDRSHESRAGMWLICGFLILALVVVLLVVLGWVWWFALGHVLRPPKWK
jgi:hypothetical protein